MIKIKYYQDKKKEWRWRMKHGGRIVAESGEGYKRKGTMARVVTNIIAKIQSCDVSIDL